VTPYLLPNGIVDRSSTPSGTFLLFLFYFFTAKPLFSLGGNRYTLEEVSRKFFSCLFPCSPKGDFCSQTPFRPLRRALMIFLLTEPPTRSCDPRYVFLKNFLLVTSPLPSLLVFTNGSFHSLQPILTHPCEAFWTSESSMTFTPRPEAFFPSPPHLGPAQVSR